MRHNFIQKIFFISVLFVFISFPCSAQIMIEQGKVLVRANPGEVVQDTINVYNTSKDATLNLRAYWQDFEYVEPFDGKKTFSAVGTSPHSCGRWVSFSPQEFTLKPLARQKISYTAKVPEDAKGGYYGVLFLEESAGKPEGSIGVSIVTRIGSLFFLESTDSNKTAAITNRKIEGNEITADFVNSGNVVMIPDATYYALDKESMVAARGEVPKFYLPPGQKVQFKIPLEKDLQPGDYSMISTFDMGSGEIITDEFDFSKSADGSIAIKASAGAPSTP